MNKLLYAVVALSLLVTLSSAQAEDIPVYAEVSSVSELMSAVSMLKPSTGGTIYLKPGTYIIKEPIVIKDSSHVSILGAGWDKTILQKQGDGDAIIFRGVCNSCSVRNIRIIGDIGADKGSGIVFEETDWSGLSTMDSLMIESFPESGIYFHGRDMTPQSSSTVSNCIIKNNRKAQVHSNANNDFFFERNHIIVDDKSAVGAYGFYLRYSSAGNISSNYISGCSVGIKLDKASCMDRIEINYFDDCSQSAIDSGMTVPADYDVSRVPRDQLYTSWEWSIAHEIEINSEALIAWNTIYASGRNPEFIALNTRSTICSMFYGNTVIAEKKIKSVVNAVDNCMIWIIRNNKVFGDVANPYVLARFKNIQSSGNVTKSDASARPEIPDYKMSELSKLLLDVTSGKDISGQNWYRKVRTTDELESAVKQIPSTGGTIYVTAGTYKVNPLVFTNKSNVKLIGSGLGTFLKGVADSDLIIFKGECNNCYVGNINISPEKATPWKPVDQKTGSGILFQGYGENFTADYCIIANWPVSCIRIEGDKDKLVKNVQIRENWIIHGKESQLYMSNCKDFTVSGNQYGYVFEDRNPYGAYFENCDNGLYELNCHWGNKIGIQFAFGCEDIQITNNRSEQSKQSGLSIGMDGAGEPNKRFVISGNTFHTNSELDPGVSSDIVALNASDVKFIANQLYTWWEPRKFKHGVELGDSSKNWRFDGNYIRDYSQKAISYNHSNGHMFYMNLIDKAKKPAKP
ncbi:MAG: right-handed parallel beta-helix repeat-containing protein [Armatimonadota bacterium]